MTLSKKVFISYDKADTTFAHHLSEDLKRLDVEVWIAPESILPGEAWVDAINVLRISVWRGQDGELS